MTNLIDFELYTADIIASILDGFLDLQDDPDFIELKLDILSALQSTEITGQHRLFIYLSYILKLNKTQVMTQMRLDWHQYTSLYTDLLEILEAILNGKHTVREPFQPTVAETLPQLLLELQTAHINPLQWHTVTGVKDYLLLQDDPLIKSAAGLESDPRGEYTDNVQVSPGNFKKEAPKWNRKSAGNDDFYRSDYAHGIFLTDFSKGEFNEL